MADQKEERIRQIQNQMALLQSKIEEVEEEDIVKIKWHPQRSNAKNVIAMSDESFLVGLPDTVIAESDPQARVVLALLGEVLTLRDQVKALQDHVGHTGRGEMTPAPELKGEARSFKEGVTAQAEAATEGQAAT